MEGGVEVTENLTVPRRYIVVLKPESFSSMGGPVLWNYGERIKVQSWSN